ncbi:HRDC-like protein [Nemania sp. FL0031]|nr:HRDC-like protein [Nemania sp. FL0031]
MRVLEAQNAVLTNVEVYTFLSDQAKQYQSQKRRGPPNLEALRGEMIKYFETFPGPLSQKPLPFDVNSIPVLLKRLRPYKISKGECIMVVNMRPTSTAALNAVIEDMENRFNEEKQEEILNIVIEVLGEFPPPAEEDEDAMETTEDGS